MSWAVKQLLNNGKEYDGLLSYIFEKNWYYSEDGKTNLPAVKDLIKDTVIPYGKLKICTISPVAASLDLISVNTIRWSGAAFFKP